MQNIIEVKLFWKGTSLVVPVTTWEGWNRLKNKVIFDKQYLDKESITYYKEQLNEIEQTMCDYEKRKNDFGKAYMQRKLCLEKIFPNKGSQTLNLWIMNIINLIECGEIQDNEDYGYLIISDGGFHQKMLMREIVEQSLCGVCKIKAKKTCSKCPQVYCCREHQKEDWKNHKLVCCKFKNEVIQSRLKKGLPVNL